MATIQRLLTALPPPRRQPAVIHVAGTNGKGSICAFVDALLRAHGLRSGLFTSPHLVRFHERIRVDGRPIPDEALDRHLGRVRACVASWKPLPSFFEVTLAVALQHFEALEVDAVVLETGLGGRLDATNAVDPVTVSVIAAIDLDHQRFLGHSLGEIAAEKAGIFKAGTPIVAAPQAAEARRVLEERAEKLGCSLTFVEEPYAGELALPGEHQRFNAAVALRAVEAAGVAMDPEISAKSLADTEWPARFHRFGEDERFVVDAAHNPAAADVLRQTWQHVYPSEKATVIFGCAEDKAVANILAMLRPIGRHFIATSIPSPRAMPLESIRAAAEAGGLAVSVTDDLAAALAAAQRFSDRILICGSIFLAGEAVARLTGQPLPRPMTQ